ncbi:AAA family ATPase [Conexibacter sp. W3-3-2]|uniref:ArsA family ATPase n=1 Tax=Conexibacter sp. W3-3-2 TaxID=2675227 RepID=UPI0012B73489|nr:ArsA-related P-loop ATPase [Conexibacter sp. W3-3-2]MTD46797.1 AAA family ATPase [Conexibacter sp. W3-3-2]
MSVARRLEGKRVCIVAGSGGVGKTTTSAAIALGLAAEGKRVAVVTIDPARRLASALGLEELGNEPHRVDPALFAQAGVEVQGELWAMMLDAKRTFDELIERLSPDERTRREILDNRIYQELSGAVAGTQEFTAIAKLYELDRDGNYDVVILDTPPSRNALDFLDAPDRLTSFFEGRALKLFLAPSGIAAKVAARGTGVVFSVLKRVTGVDLLQDLSVFFRALGGIIDGFTERASGVKALLADPGTTFLIVTSPQREPVDEAIFFRGKLDEARMPFGGLIVNRVTPGAGDEEVDVPALTASLTEGLGGSLAGKVAKTYAEAQALARRDRRAIARLQEELRVSDPVLVPQLDGDVHDIGGLARVQQHLFASDAERERLLAQAAGLA